jgi:hypothetical protein
MKKLYNDKTLLTALSDDAVKDDELLQIIEKFPESVVGRLDCGAYPLHVACWLIHTEIVILPLLKKYPQAAAVATTNDGFYPLHHVCGHCNGENLVVHLLKSFPLAASIKTTDDEDASYPLHIALYWMHNDKSIYPLLKACPQVAFEKDYQNWLPLHQACDLSKTSEHVIFMLLDTNLLAVKDGIEGESTPLDLARRGRQSEKVISILEILVKKSDYELANHINIPADVTMCGLPAIKNRNAMYHWLLMHSPTAISTSFVHEQTVPAPSPLRKRAKIQN